jgi:hypothetical protein
VRPEKQSELNADLKFQMKCNLLDQEICNSLSLHSEKKQQSNDKEAHREQTQHEAKYKLTAVL